MRNAGGEIVGASKIARDITQQKRAEALRESNQRFRLMADSAPVLIWIADQAKGRSWFNKRWLDFTGPNARAGAGVRMDARTYTRPTSRIACRLTRRGFRFRLPFQSEFRLRRADGEPRWVIEQASPLEGAGRSFSGYIRFLRRA